MSTKSNGSTPENKRRKQIFYIILIVLLVLVNGFLFYSNIQSKSENTELTQERNELLEQKAIFENKIDSLKVSLRESEGLNVELDSIIQAKVKELDDMKVTYSRRIADKEVEIAELNEEVKAKIRQVDRLKRQYEQEIDDWKERYATLEDEKTTLEDTLDTRESHISELNKRIGKGEILSAASINGYGVKYRSNNREKETDRANKVDKLVVCFTIAANRLADSGYKEILVKITSPEGTTLAVESMGSGTFELAETGESSLYTKPINIDYDPGQPDKEYCAEWTQENDFEPGEYAIELYQQGYLIGESSMELRDSWLF